MTEKVNNIKKTHRGKADTTKNSDGLQEKIEEIKKETLFPLRINKQTVILVTKDKNNVAYAKQYFEEKMNANNTYNYVGSEKIAMNKIDKNKLQNMLSQKRTKQYMARHFDVSITTINSFIRENNLKR